MGVKSFGCENSTAHDSPIQSWKRIGPAVVWASKSGAVSPICKLMARYLLPPVFSAPPYLVPARLRSGGGGAPCGTAARRRDGALSRGGTDGRRGGHTRR